MQHLLFRLRRQDELLSQVQQLLTLGALCLLPEASPPSPCSRPCGTGSTFRSRSRCECTLARLSGPEARQLARAGVCTYPESKRHRALRPRTDCNGTKSRGRMFAWKITSAFNRGPRALKQVRGGSSVGLFWVFEDCFCNLSAGCTRDVQSMLCSLDRACTCPRLPNPPHLNTRTARTYRIYCCPQEACSPLQA